MRTQNKSGVNRRNILGCLHQYTAPNSKYTWVSAHTPSNWRWVYPPQTQVSTPTPTPEMLYLSFSDQGRIELGNPLPHLIRGHMDTQLSVQHIIHACGISFL